MRPSGSLHHHRGNSSSALRKKTKQKHCQHLSFPPQRPRSQLTGGHILSRLTATQPFTLGSPHMFLIPEIHGRKKEKQPKSDGCGAGAELKGRTRCSKTLLSNLGEGFLAVADTHSAKLPVATALECEYVAVDKPFNSRCSAGEHSQGCSSGTGGGSRPGQTWA